MQELGQNQAAVISFQRRTFARDGLGQTQGQRESTSDHIGVRC